MFRELRATAPQTYYTFRASNGTADVLYVLLESLTALGLQALFFRRAKMWAGRNIWRALRGWQIDVDEEAICFVKTTADVRQLSPGPSVSPQTCDKSVFGVLEVNFDERTKKLRLYWFLYCFWELCKKSILERQRWRTGFGTDLVCRCITYYKYSRT